MMPRLFLAEDDSSIRQMVAFFVTKMCRCEVVGQAADGQEALRECERLRPAVIVADLRLPRLNGVELLREVRRRQLGASVMFYTGAMHEACVREAIEAEPEGFIFKSDDLASLRQAVEAVCAGASFWSPQAAETRRKVNGAKQKLSQLTAAELEVLRLVMQGKCSKEIAEKLHKAIDTVKHQRQSIMSKLGVHSAIALAQAARAAGIAE
jgi:DNA-binding NarL/FixJ family response regulator